MLKVNCGRVSLHRMKRWSFFVRTAVSVGAGSDAVLELSRRQMKILYDDVKDEDSCTNLEEWVAVNRVAKADKLGMRHAVRPTLRPTYPSNERSHSFGVGDPADVWWCDGWWEGIICDTIDGEKGIYQIYLPGENMLLSREVKNLRISLDWAGDGWVDIEPNPNILGLISTHSPTSFEEQIDELAGMALTNVP